MPLNGTGDIGISIGVGAEPGIILLNSCVANCGDVNLGINGGEEEDSFYRSEGIHTFHEKRRKRKVQTIIMKR